MIGARFRDANSIVVSGYRRKIEYDKQRFMIGFACIAYYRLLNIMAVDPIETLMMKIILI